jgi:hypothetical protein
VLNLFVSNGPHSTTYDDAKAIVDFVITNAAPWQAPTAVSRSSAGRREGRVVAGPAMARVTIAGLSTMSTGVGRFDVAGRRVRTAGNVSAVTWSPAGSSTPARF